MKQIIILFVLLFLSVGLVSAVEINVIGPVNAVPDFVQTAPVSPSQPAPITGGSPVSSQPIMISEPVSPVSQPSAPIPVSQPVASPPVETPYVSDPAPSSTVSIPEVVTEPVVSQPTGTGSFVSPVNNNIVTSPTPVQVVVPTYDQQIVSSQPTIVPLSTLPVVANNTVSSVSPQSNYNHNPVVTAGDDVVVAPGSTITLSASLYDPDGDRCSVYWTVTGGTLYNRNSLIATFKAPANRNSVITIYATCTARDTRGGTGSDRIKITVNPWYNPTPVPTPTPGPGTNRNPIVSVSGTQVVNSGELIRVSCTASDPDGDGLTYEWYATEGAVSSPSGTSTTVTTPTMITTVRTMVIIITVRDNRGGVSSDTMQVKVMPTNSGTEPSVTMPGISSVRAGGTISITPTVTSPRGLPLRYVWYCTQGSINNINSKDIVFTAPNNPGTIAVCSLIAIDSQEGHGSNSIKISVL